MQNIYFEQKIDKFQIKQIEKEKKGVFYFYIPEMDLSDSPVWTCTVPMSPILLTGYKISNPHTLS